MPGTDAQAETFIAKWGHSEGSERGNYQTFLYELCVLLGVETPEPAVAHDAGNAYGLIWGLRPGPHRHQPRRPRRRRPRLHRSLTEAWTGATASSSKPSKAARPPRNRQTTT